MPRRTTKEEKTASEAELAARVIEWLTEQGYECYQEVQIFSGGGVCDIVATHGPVTVAVECKVSLTLAVLEQANSWKWVANMVYVATPIGRKFGTHIAQILDLGVIFSSSRGAYEEVRPEFRRRVSPILRSKLRDIHKTYAVAGNPNGRRWTPFQNTCDGLRVYVKANPGCSMKDAIAGISHHYQTPATATSAMAVWIGKGIVKGIRLEREGRLIKLYATD